MSGILVIGEVHDGGLAQVSGELLAVARKLAGAGIGGGVQLALAGDDLAGVAAIASEAGADRVYLLEHEALAMGGTGGYDAPVTAVTALCRAVSPDVVLLARTDFGSVVAPRVAYRLGAPLAQDCMDATVAPGSGHVAVTRPVHGGNAMAVYVFEEGEPRIITIRPSTFDPLDPPGDRAEVEHFAVDLGTDGIRSRLIRVVAEEGEGVRLEDAAVVVSGGRGMGGPEPFAQLEEVAGLLGGAVGASRAACDAGWVDHGLQVGLTGKSVAPGVYLAVGISGASQHMAGISGARNIVAINKDGDANIFRAAKYGVVGEWQKVLPSFIAAVRDLVG